MREEAPSHRSDVTPYSMQVEEERLGGAGGTAAEVCLSCFKYLNSG